MEGEVVELYQRPGETLMDRGRINYEPVVAYFLDGRERRASVGSGHTSFNIPVGESARVRALPGGTGNVRMDSAAGMWFVPAVIGLLGLVTLALAALLWAGIDRLLRRRALGHGKSPADEL
ncbi:hypothetical protein [Pelagovum pacificum]|uniref:DUF3592 domain-containing protein n=1 Tax=Pelagovum pacificum TaxID=2588711 RepID=A0A5C5GCY4_9RHOB|nr:hypothetical protein [Pelagovum pacificum]QQA41354.1 hypothetical protein I8N54_10985 [Pelagovum pacificum]TNY31841.1 hypothetical protein FHY64_00615 [Pelagovum pacificum]